MRPRVPVASLCSLVLAILLALCDSPVGAAPRGVRGGFAPEARHIVSLIGSSGSKALSRFALRNGILVVRREADWKRTGEPFREAEVAGPDDIDLGGLVPLVWTEVETRFEGRDLSARRFKEIGARFRHFVHVSRQDFHGEDYSLDMPDGWGSRRLGPAAAGKLASNEFWFVYFVRERGQWRVWRLELAYH